jgi:hypothetical protein
VERIQTPNKIGIIEMRVKKIKRSSVILEALESGVIFDFPLNLLPENIAEGEKLNLKIFNEVAKEENNDEFARKLLEGIIN